MSKIIKNIKSLFVVDDGESEKTSKNTASKSRKSVPPKRDTVTVSESTEGNPGKVNVEFTDVLMKALEEANFKGFDYLEYRKSLQSLGKMDMDEATQYQSAFAMAQTMGVTPKKLIDSANQYIAVLHREESKFQTALTNQNQQLVGSNESQIIKLTQEIDDKKKEIERLTNEIDKNHQEKLKLEDSLKSNKQKINTTKNNFIASYNTIVRQIESDVEKMTQYLD